MDRARFSRFACLAAAIAFAFVSDGAHKPVRHPAHVAAKRQPQHQQPQPDEPGVLRATLPNGLRVILVRNALAPVVSTAVNYLAGGDDTPDGFPGTAHAQEHMMFRGSPGLTADQLANI